MLTNVSGPNILDKSSRVVLLCIIIVLFMIARVSLGFDGRKHDYGFPFIQFYS